MTDEELERFMRLERLGASIAALLARDAEVSARLLPRTKKSTKSRLTSAGKTTKQENDNG